MNYDQASINSSGGCLYSATMDPRNMPAEGVAVQLHCKPLVGRPSSLSLLLRPGPFYVDLGSLDVLVAQDAPG